MPLWMKTGTINLVNGSKNVVGVGTQFITATVPARPGQPLVINGVLWEIENITSNTALTLALPYTGATANSVAYTILTTMEGSFNDLARRAAQVMGAYQAYMDVYETLFTGTGNVTVTLPDGGVIVLPAWNTMQPKDATLSALSGKPTKAFGLARLNDTNATEALTALGASSFGRSRLADADASAQRTALGLKSAALRDALGASGPLYSRDSIVGAVTQSAGVPTGAIIEAGGSGNSRFVKYADGTLICRVVSLGGALTGTGALMALQWTFPVPTVGFYNVTPAWLVESGYNPGPLQLQTKTTTSIYILVTIPLNVVGYVDATLIGRWY